MADSVIKKIPIDKITPDNIRELDDDFVDWLAISIRENGLECNIEVYEDPEAEGWYKLFDGHHRFAALQEIHKEDADFWAEIPCHIRKVPKDQLELRLHQLLINMGRRNFTAADTANTLRLFRNLGLDEMKIAQRLCKSKSWVTNHLRIADDGTQKLKEANQKKQINNTTAQRLANFDSKAQDKWVKKILKEKEKAETSTEAARAEQKVLDQAFKKDRPKNLKPHFPRALRKSEVGRMMAELHDMNHNYIKNSVNGKRSAEPHEPRLEGALRGLAMAFGAGDGALYNDFNYKKWFQITFGASIEDDKWFN